MAAIASTNFAQPRTPVSAPTSAQGERVSSAGRVSSGNALMSPRLKHVRNNQSSNGVSDIINSNAVSTPPTAATIKPPNSYVDVHQLLHEMDTHQQNLHEKNHGVAFSNKSRETSPNQRRNYSPTSNNQYHLRAERDMLHDRCQQLQQQVRSLQLAYKESAMRRVQEEQSFREILRSERERFDRQISRLQSKIDDRDTLLLEWVKAVYERNTADKSDGKGEFIPEIAQSTPQIKDLRNIFSFLTARTAVCVSAAKQYLTQDDIDRANAVSRDEAKRKRARSMKKNKKTPQKKKKNHSNEQPEVDDDEEDNDANGQDNGQDPIDAFRSQKKVKTSSAKNSMRKKVGGAARIRKALNNQTDTDDNSTVAGSIMDVDDLLQLQDDMDIGNYRRNHLTIDDDDEDGDEEHGNAADEDVIEGEEADDTEKRRDSTNQSNSKKDDSFRILQELVDAFSLEEQLSGDELTEKNLKQLTAQNKKKGPSSQTILKEASQEIQDFLTLSEEDKETDRIINEYLAQNIRLEPKESKNATNAGVNNKIDSSSQKPINTNVQLKQGTNDKAKENELPATTSQTGRTTMSAATNATFSSLNFTPLSTASSQQKPMSVTGKNMEDYMRNMRTNAELDHAGLYAGLTGIEDNRDLETQLADIMQSVSDITKSIESSGDFVNSPIVPTIGSNKQPLAKKENEVKTKPVNSAALAEENKQKRIEEEQQIANLNEYLQSATLSVDEARVAVASGHQSHVRFNVDDGTDKGTSSKNGAKSVPVKPSPEEELRQLLQKTVKSTAEVTKGSAQQGQVASATRELQNVVLRSSIDMSADANLHANSTKAHSSTNKTVGGNASTLAQGSQKASTKLQPVSNSTSIASTTKKDVNANSNATSKAQQMVEAYTGAPDAISGNTNHTNAKAPSHSSKPTNTHSTATTSKPIVNAAPPGSGSVGSDGKYWWDLSVGNSVEGASPAAGIAAGGTNATTTKASSGNNDSNKPSAATSKDLKGGDSMGDSLKLGGELDN